MTKTQTNSWLSLTGVLIGLALIDTGLLLAGLSNPGRFSLNVTADRQIYVLAAAGFSCTLAGLGLLLTATRHTTASMPSQQRTNANIGVGVGLVLQLAGLSLSVVFDRALGGLLLILAGVPMMIWGCVNYAEGKRYPKSLGLIGMAGILGLIVLMVLPNRPDETLSAENTRH